MTLGTINHLTLTVQDITVSERRFYGPVLEYLGFHKAEAHAGLSVWIARTTGVVVNLWQAKPEFTAHRSDRYAPGLHHVAFHADNRDQVDHFDSLLVEIDADILHPPAFYDEYAPGYYAIYCADPDGLKIELTHIPASRSIEVEHVR